MADSEKESGKKKGGKLPIILAIVLMLSGGGFFMMKGGKNAKKEPEIKLSKEEILLPDEFIVNLADGKTFVRAKVGLRTKDGVLAEEVTKHDAEISDAINLVLKNTKVEETITEKHIKKIKMLIADKVNGILNANSHDTGHSSKKKKKKTDEEDIPEGGEDWDSFTGPVLKVFFKSFATQ
jgi:flagellar basal body-associated protein FliL